MTIEIDIPDEKLKNLAKDIMDNYPEASSSTLGCTSWNYKTGIFKFQDLELETTHTVKTEDIALKALPIFIEGVIKGRWHFSGLDGTKVLCLDACDYDAYASDALVQIAIFGDVIYG
jgi:hypothetical protein